MFDGHMLVGWHENKQKILESFAKRTRLPNQSKNELHKSKLCLESVKKLIGILAFRSQVKKSNFECKQSVNGYFQMDTMNDLHPVTHTGWSNENHEMIFKKN